MNDLPPTTSEVLRKPGVHVRLDWRAYFEEFSRIHGGSPMMWQGRLLFQDGWMYSATDYRGPEYSPPADPRQLTTLKRSYWLRRLAIVRQEHHTLGLHIRALEDEQEMRSAPLVQVVTTRDENTGKRVRERLPLDLEPMRQRLLWLAEDIQNCEENLTELEPPPPIHSNGMNDG